MKLYVKNDHDEMVPCSAFPGTIRHRTGASPSGGIVFGAMFGVTIAPGLYAMFGTLAESRSLIREEKGRFRD